MTGLPSVERREAFYWGEVDENGNEGLVAANERRRWFSRLEIRE